MLTVSSTPVELIDDNTAQQYYNDLDTLEGAERDSRAEALRLWADQKDADQKREQFDTLNKIYSDFEGYVNDAGLQDFDEESRYRTANRQFIASQFDDTVENQQTIYPSFRDKWTESVAGKKGLTEKETFGLIKQGIDARNEVSQAANEIPGDIALALFDSLDGGAPVDVPKLIDTWKTKNAESIKKLPKGWETPLLEAAQKYHTETDTMLRDYAEPLKQVYDHFAAVTGRDTERAGESNPKNQEELDSLVDTLASMPKPVRERAYASVVLGAKKAGQDPKTFMDQWGESWSRTLNMVRTGALTAQEMAAESEARQLEDKQNPPDYYISKSTGEKIPLANRAFHEESDLRKVTPEEIAAEAATARQKVKRFEVIRELQSVADNQFDPIEKINKGGFLGFMEAMAYGTPQSLAYTGTALIPFVGPYLAGTAIFADEYNQLREQGMSVDQAVQVGSVSAGIQAGLERTGAELIFGKLPVFEKLMRRIANPARVGKAGSAGIRFFSAALGENITEGAQDLTTPLVQDVAEALGADVPDVQWQPILEKWSGSRLDVLAATIPTILLGTGVATFGDNKRFAQFEERQDIYRSMGMDDATIKEIEDGKDISEKQQKFQTAFSKLTPENVKAGVAYMEEKIASAQGQQQDPNTPTLTRATLADGTTQFIVRDEQGRIAYRTAEEQSAQIAMRELLRNQITGSTRGIVESLQFIDQVNQATNRGEDVQKLLIDGAPRTLLDEYEANPTEQNLNNLFATVRAFGQDISEPAELANFPVLASNQGALAEGIFKSVIRIQDGATGVEVMRDFSQDNLKRAIAENRITMDWVREQLNQVIPLIESDRLEGRSLRTETDTDVIESFSDVAVAYMNGRIRDEQVPAGFRGFLRRMAIVVKDIFRRAYRLKRAIADGKVDTNFESFLAESVGLNQQTLVDTTRERVSNEVLTDTNFSIGNVSRVDEKGIHPFAKPRPSTYANPNESEFDPSAILETLLRGKTGADSTKRRKHGRTLARFSEIVDWAESQGRTIDPSIFAERKELGSGGEHLVFQTEGERVYKLTKPGLFGIQADDAGAYLQRWALANRLFNDDARIEGIVKLPGESDYRTVISHRHIDGRDSTRAEIQDYLQSHGFVKVESQWIHPTLGIAALDAETAGNSITMPDGTVAPVDLNLQPASPQYLQEARKQTGLGGQTNFSIGLSRNPSPAATNYSIGLAPNGKPSNLTPNDQALAMSPAFKEWAGDWEMLAEDAAWKKTIEDYFLAPNRREPLSIGRVPPVLRAVGVSDAPMVMPPSVIQKVTVKKHTLTREMVEQIPSALRDPIFVFNSATAPDSVTVLTDIRHEGRNVIAAIHMDRPAPRAPANILVSLHERPASQIEKWIKDGLILYANQGKARAYFRSARLQLPREGSKAGNPSLRTESDVVNRFVNPESITVKTDENGEPLASEIARFRQETGTSNFSIASQSQIDRVNKALGGMNRGPDERLKVYERAKQKFSKLMAWNSDELAAMVDTGSDDSQIRRTQILQALGELDGILSVLPPEVRGRVGGYTKLAGIAPMDVLKDGVKVSEVSGMNGAIISAWMREGQNIGQAGKQVSLPPGYTATENLGTARSDKAIADFFRDRIKKIDTELEKVLVREYTEAITKAVKQSRPKAGDNGVRKSTLGAETQKFADMVQRATLLDDEATPKRMAEIEARLNAPDATAEDISALSEEWSILNTFGDLDNRSSETLAQGLDWLKGQLQMGREAWRIKEQARIDEQRARAAATIEWLGKGTAKKRNSTKTKSELASDLANHYLLSHANFEQFVTAIFPPEIAANWSERLRKADEASQTAEIRDRKGILDAVRAGAKAANMSTADALLWLKADQKNAVAYLEGRMVKDERIAIDLAHKIVTGEADRSNLSDADVETLRAELAALPADTQKEFVTIKRVIFRGKEDRLHMSRGKAIQYLLSWNQPDVQIKMRKEGWTDESAADLQALVNDPVSREVMAYAKEFYGKGAGIVNPVYSRMFGMNMPQVKNYAPTRFLNAKDSKDISLDGSPTATGTIPSFAKSRVTHSAKIAPEDALTVMQGHIAQQAHWVHFAELAREFRAILSNPEVRESIKQSHGEKVLTDAELWADQMEQRGGNKAREVAWINTIIGAALSGKAISSLGFNLKTLAMQLENTIRFGLSLDTKQIVSALSNPSTIVEDIQTVWDSPAIQNRLEGGATAEARFLFSRYAGKPNFAAKISEASMTPINWLDSAATSVSSAIVYRANLNDALASGMPENLAKQAALDAASQAIYRFAQPVSFGQKSILENSGDMLAKTFFLFMSDPRLKTAILADAARGLATGQGNSSEHIRRIVAVELMAIVSHVISSAFRDAFSGDDDEEIWNFGGFAKAILLAPLQGFFFAGTVGELAISKLTGQKFYTSTQNPFVTSMEQAIRAGTNMEDAINFDDPEAMFKEWNNIFRSMALAPWMAAPAVLLNMVKPALGLYQNATTED